MGVEVHEVAGVDVVDAVADVIFYFVAADEHLAEAKGG